MSNYDTDLFQPFFEAIHKVNITDNPSLVVVFQWRRGRWKAKLEKGDLIFYQRPEKGGQEKWFSGGGISKEKGRNVFLASIVVAVLN